MLRNQNSARHSTSSRLLCISLVVQLSLVTTVYAGNDERLHHPFERGKRAEDIFRKKRDAPEDYSEEYDDFGGLHPFSASEADYSEERLPPYPPEEDYNDESDSTSQESERHSLNANTSTNTSQINSTIQSEVTEQSTAFSTQSVIETVPNTLQQTSSHTSVKPTHLPILTTTTELPHFTNDPTTANEVTSANSGIVYSSDLPSSSIPLDASHNPSSNMNVQPQGASEMYLYTDTSASSMSDQSLTTASATSTRGILLENLSETTQGKDGDNTYLDLTEAHIEQATTTSSFTTEETKTFVSVTDASIITETFVSVTDASIITETQTEESLTDTLSYTTLSEEECSKCTEVKALKREVRELRQQYNSILEMFTQLNESLTKTQNDVTGHVVNDSQTLENIHNNLTTQVEDVRDDVMTSLSRLENNLMDRIHNLTRTLNHEQERTTEEPLPGGTGLTRALSVCRYSSDTSQPTSTADTTRTYSRWCPSLANSRQGWVVASVQCATYGGTQSFMERRLDAASNNWRYRCVCKGVFLEAEERICEIQIWECPPE